MSHQDEFGASPGQSTGSGAGTWMAILLAVLVLYMASPGPLAKFYKTRGKPPPEWVRMMYAPLAWSYEKLPPVKKVYDVYFHLLGVDA